MLEGRFEVVDGLWKTIGDTNLMVVEVGFRTTEKDFWKDVSWEGYFESGIIGKSWF